MVRNFKSVFSLSLLLLLIGLVSVYSLPIGEAPIRLVSDPVVRPLPSVPEFVVMGEPFDLILKAPSNLNGLSVNLTSIYGVYRTEVLSSIYDDLGFWNISLMTPSKMVEGLYSLEISYFSSEGDVFYFTQSRCVYVMSSEPKSLLIAHITDPHLPYGADVLARAVYELDLIRPSLIILSGDFVDVDTIESAWRYGWDLFLDGPCNTPTYLLPGNHDHSGDNAANFKKFGGPLYYESTVGPFHIIALDSTMDGYISLDQLSWAESILKDIDNGVTIMSFHHPLFNSGPCDITGSWDNIDNLRPYLYYSWNDHIENSKKLLRLIQDYDIKLILSGHIHREQFNILNGEHVFETNLPAGGSLREDVHDYQAMRCLLYTSPSPRDS